RWSAASSWSTAGLATKRSRSQPAARPPNGAPSRCARSLPVTSNRPDADLEVSRQGFPRCDVRRIRAAPSVVSMEAEPASHEGEPTMRFMILVKATPQSEAGVMPEEQLIATMTDFHQKLAEAGALLDASGLQPSAKGW